MLPMTKACLIVTTYNRPDALDRVLASIARLSVPAQEVVIADDGSTGETREVILKWKQSLPLAHVWQPDVGFRAAEARNRAVLACSAEYLIFLDGDCLVFPDFVEQHLKLAEDGRMVVGNRVLLSERLTNKVLSGQKDPVDWDVKNWKMARRAGEINRLIPLTRFGGRFWRLLRPRQWKGVHTCNLGLWKSDFELVNGFDESYHGWGHEDADLAIRLMRKGVFRKDGQFAVPVLHLWHQENSRGSEMENKRRLEAVINGQRPISAECGISQHIATP